MEILFWILVGLVFYTYIGYGILLFFLVKIKSIFSKEKNYDSGYFPEVTLVIPAYNEEDYIVDKAKNSLALTYPKEKLKILFITDGSTDGTYNLLKNIPEIEVTHEDRRGGKSAAENRAMTLVDTPIVVFCDANTHLNIDCIQHLVKHYQNPAVGAVAGEKKVISVGEESASGAGEGLYWKYESTLKKWDAELYSVVGAAGELISFRSSLVDDLEENTILDDFVQSLRICKKGFRVMYEPQAFATETASQNVKEELKRKVRISAGGWQAMARLTSLFNFFKHPVLTFQYVSHRVLRWSLAAFSLPLIFLLNLAIWLHLSSEFYGFLLAGQILFYGMAMLGWWMERRGKRSKLLFIPYYFSMMNFAVFAGFLRWLKGDQKSTWEKAKRADPASVSV